MYYWNSNKTANDDCYMLLRRGRGGWLLFHCTFLAWIVTVTFRWIYSAVASPRNSPQSHTPIRLTSRLCRANPRYQTMDAVWAHIPTTRAPARHLEYQAIMSPSSYFIQSLYVFDDVCLLCMRILKRPPSSLCIWMAQSPSICYCA